MVTIKLKDKRNNCMSEPVSIEDLIFSQGDIEFRFPGYMDEYTDEPYEASLPYKDFLFFQDDYQVIVHISNNHEE